MKRLTTAIICIAGALTATTALAQKESQPGLQPPGATSSRDTIYGATGRSSHQGTQVRATKVIGADVKTSTGESLGKIEDIILNPSNGRAEFAVVNWENKLVPVPFKVLSCDKTDSTSTTPGATMDRPTFTAQIDREKLQNAPTISDRGRWSELQQPNFSQRIYSHYGMQHEGVGAPGGGIERGPGQDFNKDNKNDNSDLQKGPGTNPKSPN